MAQDTRTAALAILASVLIVAGVSTVAQAYSDVLRHPPLRATETASAVGGPLADAR